MNRPAMTQPHPLFKALAAALVFALPACSAPQPDEKPPLAGAKIGGDFTLTHKTGKTVKWADFAGRWRIVYFGFTYCPDACPLDMTVLMQGFNDYAKTDAALASQIQPIFITIDPARDTPARVGEFAAAFSPRLLGLTGTPAQVDQAAKAFAAYYGKGRTLPDGQYLMDHSRIAYLMDRDGKPVAMLPLDQGRGAVKAELAKWVK